MYCRERRKLLSAIEDSVELYRTVVDSIISLDSAASNAAMDRANAAYNACQVGRAALRRHERSHGCSVAIETLARSA
jgi:hypothetical protein